MYTVDKNGKAKKFGGCLCLDREKKLFAEMTNLIDDFGNEMIRIFHCSDKSGFISGRGKNPRSGEFLLSAAPVRSYQSMSHVQCSSALPCIKIFTFSVPGIDRSDTDVFIIS